MTDNRARNGTLGAILGALIAVAFAVFLLNGGEHVGKRRSKATPIFHRSQPGNRANRKLIPKNRRTREHLCRTNSVTWSRGSRRVKLRSAEVTPVN